MPDIMLVAIGIMIGAWGPGLLARIFTIGEPKGPALVDILADPDADVTSLLPRQRQQPSMAEQEQAARLRAGHPNW